MNRYEDDVPRWQVTTVVIAVIMISAAVGFGLLMLTRMAHAREGGDWSNVTTEVREWIMALKMPDGGEYAASCCGPADAYECDRGVTEDDANYCIITDTRGNPLPVGTKLLVPPKKVQNKQGNPTGHVIVFANGSGTVYCFIPSGGM